MFCGDAIGEAIPPTLDANAIPKIKALMKCESFGRVSSNGCINEKQRTGAATLDTHIDANNAILIIVNNTTDGFVPAFDRIQVDNNFAMLYFVREAAKVNPPSKSNMTEFHIVDKMYFDESTVFIRDPSEFLRTPKLTIRRGINNDVTNRGIVSVAQSKDEQTSRAKQFFCAVSRNGEKFNKISVTATMRVNLSSVGLRNERLKVETDDSLFSSFSLAPFEC